MGGMDVSRIDPETLLSLYSIVFQDVTLFDNTILENIRIGNKDATDEQVIALRNLPMWMNLRKNCRMDGIPISEKMAVNYPAESASVSLLPVHF